MKEKVNIQFLLLSMLISISVVGLYHVFLSSGKIIIEERIPIQLAAHNYTSTPVHSSDIFVSAAAKCTPAVVFIQALKRVDEFYRDEYTSTSGSGVIVSPKGYIVTNQHVIKDADELLVQLNDKREFNVRVVGVDPSTDLAVLKIDEENLPYIGFGNSSAIKLGEWVMAIGNPFGLESSVTAGIVSAKARNIELLANSDVESFIQTDAAINPGNSGGALINTRGELIGINSAIVTKSGRYEGYSFAIPSILVQKVFTDIIEYGAVQRGWMGVTVSNVNADLAHELNAEGLSGVKVEMANQNGAAIAGGIKRNDVILSIKGMPISSTPEFNQELALYRPGDIVEIELYRKGKIIETKVTLRNYLNSTDLVTIRKDKVLVDLGFELRDLDKIETKRLKTSGALVVSVYKNSVVAESNLEPNYIITKLNNKRINNTSDLIAALRQSSSIIELEGFYEDVSGKFPYTIVKSHKRLN